MQVCEIHDVLAYGRCYIVKPVGLPRMPAMLGSQCSSMLPVGARDITMLMPGSLVLCWISEKHYAVILAVLTSPMGSSQMSWPDSIVAAGHAGIFADPAHQILATKETSHGFLDFSGGGPIDSLPGDWGKTNELGMAFFLGRLMASIKAGELCKLEMHYTDMLARLYAYNWQHYTAGSEDEAFDDEGEWTRIRGFSPFPWEAAGVAKKGAAFDKKEDLNPKDAQDRFGIEPSDPLQASFVRYKEFEGFLGDLRRRFVVMPVTKPASGLAALASLLGAPTVRTYGRATSDAAQYKGLLEEVVGIDGSWLLRSAKGIGLEKTVWIPVPEELYPRDNPKGDHDLKDAAGEGMDFTEYPDQGTAGKNIARLRDSQSYDLNKRKSEPLNKRTKDWAIRDDEGGIQVPGEFQTEIPGLTPYATFEQGLPPSADEIVAEMGNRKSKFYQSKAFMGILPDGSILMRDGYGSEIRMCGGNIELSCPGDVVMRTGRTMQFWGGKDVIIKAHDNLEMSTANGSARLKAEHNLEMLGGNDQGGGVLVESRGNNTINQFSTPGDSVVIGGLVLKSSRGPVSVWGNTLYMRSMTGAITMDSQGGDGNFIVYANQLTKYLTSGSREVVAGKKNETGAVNTFVMENTGGTFNYFGLSANFGVSSMNLVAAKGTSTTTNLTVAGGITSEGSVSGVGKFGEGTKPPVSALADLRKEAITKFNTENTAMKQSFGTDITGSEANGNKAVYGLIGFSFRSSTDLGLGDMVIYEAEWQKRFRQTAKIKADAKYSSVWDEPVVAWHVNPDTWDDDQGNLTRPFPGWDAWENGEGAKYAQVDDQFYLTDVNSEGTGGRPLPRGEKGKAYDLSKEAPKFSEEGFKKRYPINR